MSSILLALLLVGFVTLVQAYVPANSAAVSSAGRTSPSIISARNALFSSSKTLHLCGSTGSSRSGSAAATAATQARICHLLAAVKSETLGEDDGGGIPSRSRRRRMLAKVLAARQRVARGLQVMTKSKVSATIASRLVNAKSNARAKLCAIVSATRKRKRHLAAAMALFLATTLGSSGAVSGQHALDATSASMHASTASQMQMQQHRPQVVRMASSTSDGVAIQNSGGGEVMHIGTTRVARRGTGGNALASTTSSSTDSTPSTFRIGRKPSTSTTHTREPMAAIGIAKPASAKTTNAATSTNDPKTAVKAAEEATKRTLVSALRDLQEYMAGPKSDTMLLLLATALVTPLCKQAGISPILGFLAAGMMMGPNALGVIGDMHNVEMMGELGIVFFLFEMGIELSIERLKSMRRDVFGLGLSQFLGTAAAVAAVGKLAFNLPANALVVLGGGLALSSSAFVLQLLKDKEQLSTRFGKASFGILLLQDLAVVPLLVVTPILAGGGAGLGAALGSALVKATLALSAIAFTGHVVLDPLFNTVAKAKTQEAFLGVTLLTVLGMSFMTEGLGLSNTLGAFLAGVLLSETKYRYQIEADIAPFRGILLGLFFVTVGFEIDVGLILSQLPLVSAVVLGILAVKAAVAALASLAFGLSLSTSMQTALIVSQAGEFAFVAFGLAKSFGILSPQQTKFLLTCVSLTMALTPFLSSVGGKIASKLEEGKSDENMVDLVRDAEDREVIESDDFVVVVGYGTVGRVVTDLLQRKFIQYECVEVNPQRAALARSKGLPVFYGDVARPEIADAFNVGKAKAVIVTIADKAEATRMVIALRRQYPGLKIFARAADADHAQRLQKTLDVVAMVPIIPEDNVLLTLPFGGAVLKSLGAQPEEVNAILEAKRKDVLNMRGQGEAEATLVELGVNTDEERAELIEALKEKSPMVAEVLSQNEPTPALEEIKETEDESEAEEVVAESVEVEADESDSIDDATTSPSFQQSLLERQLKQS